MVWNPANPTDFSEFTAEDMPAFLQWWELNYESAIALGIVDAFVEGVTQPYLEALANNQPIPQWLLTVLATRKVAQDAFQEGQAISQRLKRGLEHIIPDSAIAQYKDRYNITPTDIAETPPHIRHAFLQGANFSLSWVKRLSNDARNLTRLLLSAETAKNRNPSNAIALVEQILRRDVVAQQLGIKPSEVTPEQIAQWIDQAELNVIKAISTRAAAISRTETMRMLNLGAIASLREQGETLGYIMPHKGSCPDCRRLIDGRVFKLETLHENLFKNFGVPKQRWKPTVPLHPNCLVGETLVSAQGVTGYSKRWYEGRFIEIATASNKKLTVTPNHPILTQRGWVAAHLINKGDYVFSSLVGQDVSTPKSRSVNTTDNNYTNTQVDKIVNSLIESAQMPPRPVPLSAKDFHGDGIDKQVAIIGTKCFLWSGNNTSFLQKIKNLPLIARIKFSPFFSRIGSLNKLRFLNDTILSRFMGFSDLPLSLLWRHFTPLKFFRLASVSEFNTLPFKSRSNGVLGNPERSSKFHNRLSRKIKRGNPFFIYINTLTRLPLSLRHLLRLAPNLDSSVDQFFFDPLRVNPFHSSQLVEGIPFPVQMDAVVDINTTFRHCYVYNLETISHKYLANGIITHNCRHSILNIPERFRDAIAQASIPPEGIVLRNYGLSSARAMDALGLEARSDWAG